ncbi:ATP-binding protein [Anaeromonas gelatinilytica]|uniref:ATP-binding protein n=1 Tax=Anaeromonas gelatinilytica TaxID=2683194 RepID=UPI0020785239|nr:ATP-binding protein [Anaeromonas gelatinilytica]
MKSYKPKVKDISLFKEIAQNLVNPLEVIREAISNSHDAESKTISIIISRSDDGRFILEIQDDGVGMNIYDIHRFFNLGDSIKRKPGIGEKGLGTKTFFKSEGIVLLTQTSENDAFKVEMKEPWKNLCNNKLPEYNIKNIDPQTGRRGTTVRIEGYIIDNPEKYFNFETVKDYIVWFTAAGSFKTYFANCSELNKYVHNMQIAPRIFLEDHILGSKEEISGVHPFHPPQENPTDDKHKKVYKKSVNYCRHFGPFHEPTNINGEYVSF